MKIFRTVIMLFTCVIASQVFLLTECFSNGANNKLPILEFSADKLEISMGESVTFTWSSSLADTCSIGPDLLNNSACSGTETISPFITKTYEFLASNTDGDSSATVTVIVNIPADADNDADGLPDSWEMTHFGTINQESDDDPDNDGLTNLQEMTNQTCPGCGPNLTVLQDDWDIKSAVEKVDDGGTVTIGDGFFSGEGNRNIWFSNKAITLRSANGPENTIIDCGGISRGVVFQTSKTSTSVLSGITIRNGYTGSSGAGILCENNASPTIINCIIENNIAIDNGGGIHIKDSNPAISQNIIRKNKAGDGSGIFINDSNVTITNCVISGNSDDHTGLKHDENGNYGGAILGTQDSNIIVINSTIVNNSCGNFGGIYLSFSADLTIKNSIVSNNGEFNQIGKYGFSPTVNIISSIVQNNIDLKFYSDDDFHLYSDSPCVDAGKNEYAPPTDIEGLTRPQGDLVDIGAYEFDYINDTDRDGIPDILEVQICTEWNDDDTDGDGIKDGVEDHHNYGVIDAGETNPCDDDTDNDGLEDGEEDTNFNGMVDAGETDPRNPDSDSDGMKDGWEFQYSESCDLDPLDPTDATADCDGDSYSNVIEFLTDKDPINSLNKPSPGNYFQYDAIGRIKSIIRIQ